MNPAYLDFSWSSKYHNRRDWWAGRAGWVGDSVPEALGNRRFRGRWRSRGRGWGDDDSDERKTWEKSQHLVDKS